MIRGGWVGWVGSRNNAGQAHNKHPSERGLQSLLTQAFSCRWIFHGHNHLNCPSEFKTEFAP